MDDKQIADTFQALVMMLLPTFCGNFQKSINSSMYYIIKMLFLKTNNSKWLSFSSVLVMFYLVTRGIFPAKLARFVLETWQLSCYKQQSNFK